jgi:hypothetical protein
MCADRGCDRRKCSKGEEKMITRRMPCRLGSNRFAPRIERDEGNSGS